MFGIKKNTYNSYIPVLLFLLAGIIWRTQYYVLSLYVAMPLIIVYSIYRYYHVIIKSKYTLLYLFLIIWMLLSSMINYNSIVSIREMIPVVGSCFLSLSVYGIAYRNDKARIIFLSYIVLFIFLMFKNITREGFVSDFDYANEAERVNNSILNANDFAYYSLYAIMSLRLFIQMLRIKIKPFILIVIYVICALVSFFVAMMVASRQVLIIQIPLIVLFIYIDFVKKDGLNRKLILLIIAIVIISILPSILDTYSHSYLAKRNEISFREDVRSELLSIAFVNGLDNPFFGLGLGADIYFSHCTYTHLLERCGFPAAIIFVIIIFYAIIDQYKRYRRTRELNFLLYFYCIVIIAVGHITYSYIDEPFLMSIMFAIVGVSDKEYKVFYQKYR